MTKWYELISNPLYTLDGTCSVVKTGNEYKISLAHNPAVLKGSYMRIPDGAKTVTTNLPSTVRRIRHPVTGETELRKFPNPITVVCDQSYGQSFLYSNIPFPSNWSGYTAFAVLDVAIYPILSDAFSIRWINTHRFVAHTDYPTRDNTVIGHAPTSDEAIVIFASIDKTSNTCYLLTSTVLAGTRVNEEQSGYFDPSSYTKIGRDYNLHQLVDAIGPHNIYAYGQWMTATPLTEGRAKVMELLDAISEKIEDKSSLSTPEAPAVRVKSTSKLISLNPSRWTAGLFFRDQKAERSLIHRSRVSMTNTSNLDLTYNYYIEDVVTKDDSPISTRLMLYEKHLGTLLGYTYSDIAGKFKILNLERSVEYVVVAYDPDRQYASIIKDYSWGSPFMKRVRYTSED